ncbi:hypothetical protein A2801_01395 [Candidatus Woesebacteria bacterium RIFCSPHIGHO2_01_FULL_41_10]|uniref:Regulatory protein RecX n=1 Tax=Candidatus Woesebacteria bacterium RIFCSPHIGHO2_01_FULL_41_10 TaxID=1802500 RepID=A0A1F7YSJ8_9BACT|nr:MAG: hypothetical protein A2801_01395 [Candidatus Woesebacteria bacterium RIFCSPHIGHO2_01_FULL_41_10]
MPRITAIKKQKREGRVSIYVDGKFAFGTDLETLVRSGLKVEEEVPEETLDRLRRTSDEQKYINKALQFASFRPRSEREIKDWCKRKNVGVIVEKKIIKKLTKLELLNDVAFTRWWVRQRSEFRPRSKRQLKAELFQKGIESQIIDLVISSEGLDEISIARKLLEKQNWKYRNLEEKERRQKQSEYLARKGYDWDTIKEVVD